MSDTINYKVKNHTKFLHEKGYKQLSKINEKMLSFRFMSQQNEFQIQLNFTSPAIINAVQIKVRFTKEIVIQFYHDNIRMVTQREIFNQQQISQGGKPKVIRLNQNAQIFNKALVRFLNYPQPLKTQINFLIFKGFKQQQTKKLNRVKNVSDNDTFEPGIKRKINEQDRGIFKGRATQKTKASPAELIQQVTKQKRMQKKNAQKQPDQQLKRALQTSLKQFEQSEKKKQNRIEQREYMIKQDNQRQKQLINLQQQQNQFFDYPVVDYDSIKKIFQHVTPQWIQAQRRAEKNRNIQSRHSLAAKIKIKLFGKMDFCFNNIHGGERTRLIKLVQQLGGKITQQPKDDCIIVTNKMQGGKINLGKTMHRVKFVKPDYIDQCDKMKAKLDQKDYTPKS